ncbi:type VI secretion system tip protein VgrG, partial [Salmonella enterica]|nr:type VI secretion system tip protein VgrG [Salmonella enterica]
VRFHWDRYCPGNEDSSCWIRVSQAWAGTGFGNLAIPRVGQEVIVDFLNGDPDQPIIMGRTYHQDNRSPGSLPGTKTKMTIRSKTYKGEGFNELSFEDATDNEQVYIHAQKDMDTEVLNNRTTDVKVDDTETIGNDQMVTVKHDQRITVKHDQTEKITNDRRVDVHHDEGLYVKNDRKVTVKGNQEHTTTGDHLRLVKGLDSLEVKGDLARRVSGALGIKVDKEIVLESSTQISLKMGASFISIHAGGVDIVGPKVNLNDGGSAGTPVETQLPIELEALKSDDDSKDDTAPDDNNNAGGGNDGGTEEDGGTDSSDENEDSEKYYLKFHFTDDDGIPYSNTKYIAYFQDGSNKEGITDNEGKTEKFISDEKGEISIHIIPE